MRNRLPLQILMFMKVVHAVAGCIFLSACAPAKTGPSVTSLVPRDHDLQADMSRFQKGIDFVASGNAPSWSLEVDFDSSMVFKSYNDEAAIVTSVPQPQARQAENSRRYRGMGTLADLVVLIQKKGCYDTATREVLPYTVSVDAKPHAGADFKTFRGCARYLVDYKLHDLWVLKEWGDGTALSEKDLPYPRLELNPGAGTVLGHTGCNEFSGKLITHGNNIVFQDITTTKMACTSPVEARFLKILLDADRFAWGERRLQIFKGNLLLCQLLKVD